MTSLWQSSVHNWIIPAVPSQVKILSLPFPPHFKKNKSINQLSVRCRERCCKSRLNILVDSDTSVKRTTGSYLELSSSSREVHKVSTGRINLPICNLPICNLSISMTFHSWLVTFNRFWIVFCVVPSFTQIDSSGNEFVMSSQMSTVPRSIIKLDLSLLSP